MSQNKVTFFFKGAGGVSNNNTTYGWTESFYRSGDEPDAETFTAAYELAADRRGLLNVGYNLVAFRFGPIDNTRLTRVYPYSAADSEGKLGEFAEACDADDALVVRLQTTAGPHRSISLRGHPDKLTEGGGAYKPFAAWTAAFNKWKAEISRVGSKWSVRHLGTSAPFDVVTIDVATAVRARAPQITVFSPITAFAANDRIYLSGGHNYPGLRGYWTVNVASAPALGVYTLTLKPKRGTMVSQTADEAGIWYCKKITPTYPEIRDVAPLYGSSRKPGRPFGQRPGRRSKR